MKTKAAIIALLLGLLLPGLVLAQKTTDDFFKKHANKKGVQSTIVSEELLRMLSVDDTDINVELPLPDMEDVDLSKIKSISALSLSEPERLAEHELKLFYEDLNNLLALPKYSQLLISNDGDYTTRILGVKEKNIIKELLISRAPEDLHNGEAILLIIKGDIDDRTFKALLSSFNI